MDWLLIIQTILIYAIPILFAITVHEVAHGWVANRCGDSTAKDLGRLTLNPLKHIDLVGTVIVPIVLVLLGGFIFGWAKPVPVDWQKLRHPRRDTALVAIAGPFTNLCMAVFWALFAKIGIWMGAQAAIEMGKIGIMINGLLMVLNVLPIPPLDGSRVVSSMLPPRFALIYNQLEPYGLLILLGLLAFGVLGKVLWPVAMGFTQAIHTLFGIFV